MNFEHPYVAPSRIVRVPDIPGTAAAALRGSDGYLRVSYDMVGVKFLTHHKWTASGALVPAGH